ncbi:unnamed protein product [Linum tenue]|uniref:Gag-pol polyprotein n=1 Tax=Linum tenue TaxID=586396 RepID=A0AAV0LL16_9ROSI|nr:unnamed protein product [Linum tenue]
MHVLQSAMNPDEADQVENCETAREIWVALESTYEGTSNIRESRIDLLVHEYEAFSMLNNESIHEMYSRFTVLINKLKGLGPKNLTTLPINELIGSLLSHENVIKQVSHDDEKRKKTLAFKSRTVDYESDDDLSDFDKEFALVSKKFHRMLKYKNDQKRRQDDSKFIANDRYKSVSQDRLPNQQTRILETGQSEREAQACYKCGKIGHIRAHCPQTLKAKERAMKATWSDYESEPDEDQEDNLAFMAFSNDLNTQTELASQITESGNIKTDYLWYLDSGCSHHMSGKKNLFSSLQIKRGGKVIFGDDSFGTIAGTGTIGKYPLPVINDVLLVEGLKHNLLSISQLCSSGNKVSFESSRCIVERVSDGMVLFVGTRHNNMYIIDLQNIDAFNEYCFAVSFQQELLWHRKLGHISLSKLTMLSKLNLARGIPLLKDKANFFCETCISGKQTRKSFKSKTDITSTAVFELIHMDLFGPCNVTSLGGKNYVFVLVDDYSRFTWVFFLAHKSETFAKFKTFALMHTSQLKTVKSDNGGEFIMDEFETFCNDTGISHIFSAPRTPQQNGVVERKNRTIIECARTLLLEYNLPKYFWAEAVNTACHVINRVIVRKTLNKTPYELLKNKPPNISYFHPFGCPCYVLNTRDQLGKFDSRSDLAIFLGYSVRGQAFRVYNKRTQKVEESVHVKFNEMTPPVETSVPLSFDLSELSNSSDESIEEEVPDQTDRSENNEKQAHEAASNIDAPVALPTAPPHIQKRHPAAQVIGDITDGLKTRGKYVPGQYAYVSQVEPKSYKDALKIEEWVFAMIEELTQFEYLHVWDLVPRPLNVTIIGTKWVFRNKSDELGIIIRNKARLVAQGYCQEEGIDYDETFAPVARLESILLLCAFASYMGFPLFQMDVKSAFLNGVIEEDVYVAQPPGFEDHRYPDHVFRLNKALYGLKQAPRAWYDRLTSFLHDQNFVQGSVDKTLFIKHESSDLLLVQIYVDDIVFGSTNTQMCSSFCESMKSVFEMSLMGELKYFLGLQIKQTAHGTFISQSKYVSTMLQKFDMTTLNTCPTPMATNVKLDLDETGESVDESKYRGMIGSLLYLTASRPDIQYAVCLCARFQSQPKQSHLTAVKRIFRYLKGTSDVGIWYAKQDQFDLLGYTDSDFAGSLTDRKSTSGCCQFVGTSLVSWFCKKQGAVALSTAEAEYIAAGSSCAQLLWLKSQLNDYGLKVSSVPLYCDNTSAICMTKNPVQHSRTKHIDIKYHFIRELVKDGHISLHHIPTEFQLADLFTKPLAADRFTFLCFEIGLRSLSSLSELIGDTGS